MNKVPLTQSYIENNQEFIKAVQQCIVDCLRFELGLKIDLDSSHLITQKIYKTLKEKYLEVELITELPGIFLQALIPSKELLCNFIPIYLQGKLNKINFELIKLQP